MKMTSGVDPYYGILDRWAEDGAVQRPCRWRMSEAKHLNEAARHSRYRRWLGPFQSYRSSAGQGLRVGQRGYDIEADATRLGGSSLRAALNAVL